MKILDKIRMTLRAEDYSTMKVYIDVYDTSLGRKWLDALNKILHNRLLLEKNYCFMGFFIYIQFHLHRLHPLKEQSLTI